MRNSNTILASVQAFMDKKQDGDKRELVTNLQAALEYKNEELRIYREKFEAETGKKQPDLTDDDRRRLARKASSLNSYLLSIVDGTWAPETVMGWYRKLIADKYNSVAPGQKKRGRPCVSSEIEAVIIDLAQANPTWGYLRIQMTLIHLGIDVSFMTVKRVMNNNGFFPPPDGRVNNDFNLFYEAHRNIVAACDFCTYELLTPHGLERRHILFFEDITTREAWCGGITGEPDANYMAQVARNQVDCFDGKLRNMKYLIHDNAMVFRGRFANVLSSAGCITKRIRPFCPEQNGYMESFIKIFKTECLDRLILTSDEQLWYVVREFLLYYNHERPHSGLGGRIPDPWPQDTDGEIVEFSRLGGLLKSYRRVKQAA